MALDDSVLEHWERDVVRVYHKHLCEALGGEYPLADLLKEFKIAALDYQRWQSGSRLPSTTPESMAAGREKIDVNHGIYRRSLPRMLAS